MQFPVLHRMWYERMKVPDVDNRQTLMGLMMDLRYSDYGDDRMEQF